MSGFVRTDSELTNLMRIIQLAFGDIQSFFRLLVCSLFSSDSTLWSSIESTLTILHCNICTPLSNIIPLAGDDSTINIVGILLLFLF